MHKQWEKTTEALANFEAEINAFIKNATLNSVDTKKLQNLTKNWSTVIVEVNKFNSFVAPIKSLDVKFPSMDDDFLATWNFYKEYLTEQFGIVLRSRAEFMSLKSLWKMAEEKPDIAVQILENCMSKTYPRFFPLTNPKVTESTTDVKPENDIHNDPDFK